MNVVCLQRNYGYGSRRELTKSKARSEDAGHGAFPVPAQSVLGNGSTETGGILASRSASANGMDKTFLLNQREMERAAFASGRSKETENEEACREPALSKNQESVMDILQLMGVELRNEVNWNSGGSAELTDEQARDLRQRYDVRNLSEEEYYNLLVELVNLNVMSGEDFEKEFVRDIPPEVLEHGGMVSAASPGGYAKEYRDYLEKFVKDAEMFEYYFRAMEERNSSIHESNFVRMQEYYKENRERSYRLAGIFRQIQRGAQESEISAESKRSFDGLDVLGPFAPDEVREAWEKAEEASGANGYGMDYETGKLTTLTELFVMSIWNWHNGGTGDILGSSVESAKEAVQKALDMLDKQVSGIYEKEEYRKEKLFYEAFLSFLE